MRLRMASACLLASAWSSPVAAFTNCVVHSADEAGIGTMDCVSTIGCPNNCMGLGVPSQGCIYVDDENTQLGTYCGLANCHAIFNCFDDGVCPAPSGLPGVCTPTTRPGFSLCVFGGPPLAYCRVADVPIAETDFFRCLHVAHTVNQATNDPSFGDCDLDGCPNSDDGASYCDMTEPGASCTPTLSPCNAIILDGGVIGPDGSVPVDGSLPDGAVRRDGAAFDARVPIPISFAGGGGCALCSAARSSRSRAPFFLIALVLVYRSARRPSTNAARAASSRRRIHAAAGR